MDEVVVRKDYETFEVPIGEKYMLKCCDCGLEHYVVWLLEEGKLYMTAVRASELGENHEQTDSSIKGEESAWSIVNNLTRNKTL